MKKSTRKISLKVTDPLTQFFKDSENAFLFKEIRDKFGVLTRINHLGMLVIRGNKSVSEKIWKDLNKLNDLKREITQNDVRDVLDGKELDGSVQQERSPLSKLEFRHKDGTTFVIKPRTEHQQDFVSLIEERKVIFGLGSPGTGKSFIAIACALKMLESKMIRKIIISRPPVETGPSIGFLPGDMMTKMEFYLIPIYSILAEILGKDKRDKLLADGIIEIMPIGFSRGVTIGGRDGVVFIVDEAQNMDFIQHKLVLTRLGSNPNSRVIIIGDQRQSDLRSQKDTLSLMSGILRKSKYVGTVTFTREDIVRSETVKEVLGLIEDYEDKKP